jgi:hypothetical protein
MELQLRLEQVVQVVAVMVQLVQAQVLMEPQILVAVLEVVVFLMATVVPAALALLSLKYLTTLAQHSLVALHLACPHLSLGSTSTL